jgi:ribosome-associated protein
LRLVQDVPIRGETIRLGQLLKLAGVIGSGAEVKGFLSRQQVWVNGEGEDRRGRQLHVGDTVRVGDQELRLTSDASGSTRPGAA